MKEGMRMDPIVTLILTIFTSVAASSGFWAWLQKRGEKNDVRTKMLLGIAHDRLVFLSMKYLDRGHISKEEYDNIYKYLYLPYKELGGNGTVEHLVQEVTKLPIKSSIYYKKEEANDE
jgi:hypothetical protein